MGFDLDRTLALAQQTQDRRMRFAALQQLQKERRMLDLHSRAEQFEENPQLLKHRLALGLSVRCKRHGLHSIAGSCGDIDPRQFKRCSDNNWNRAPPPVTVLSISPPFRPV